MRCNDLPKVHNASYACPVSCCNRPHGVCDLRFVDGFPGGRAQDHLASMQLMLKRIETELSQLRAAAWTQHKAQPQISQLRRRTGAARSVVSVALSNLHYKATRSVVAAHFSVIGPVVRVTILYNKRTGAPHRQPPITMYMP